ncbi:unnamed protein product [Mycena citricolor]|uniref:NmrA-like domain-containing protein n=1 Tax=Mycena citricolor TaxID=2018698 RepID=A0AAD2Q3Y4_9AGAR|nr:unnamed protein product [Mycena citricolor]CAK5283652.1 unnamed protein product [Mycena citricolor]
MSFYSSFAVIGAGLLGGPIIAALAAEPSVKVILLSRSASKTVPENVQVVQVPSYDDVAAVTAALKSHNVEVIVSTLSTGAIPAQAPLVDAAKQAGVKLFVPSEFGAPTDGHTELEFGQKNKIAGQLRSVGVPYLRIFNGVFTEFLTWAVNYDAAAKKIYVIGKSEGIVSVTSIGDVAGYVAHVLTHLPPSALENQTLRIEGDRVLGYRSLGPLLGAEVETVKTLEGEMAGLKTFLMQIADQGIATTGHGVEGVPDEEASKSGNALWPGHQWKTVKDVLGL